MKSSRKPTRYEPDELERDLAQGKIERAYVLVGDDADQRDFAFRAIQNAVVEPATRDFNCDVFYGGSVDAASVIATAAQFPMMAQRRFTGVKQAERVFKGDLERIADAVPSLPDTTVIVIDAGELDGRSSSARKFAAACRSVICRPLSEERTAEWLSSAARKHGITLDGGAVRLLIASHGNRLGVLSGELSKLDALLGKRRSATESDVRMIVGTTYDETPYGLADAIGGRDVDRAIAAWESLDGSGAPPTLVLSVLSTSLIRWAALKGLSEREARAAAEGMGVHSFFAARTVESSARFTERELEERILLLADAERRIKSGVSKADETLAEVVALLAGKVALGGVIVGDAGR